jgi:hypothetical protein
MMKRKKEIVRMIVIVVMVDNIRKEANQIKEAKKMKRIQMKIRIREERKREAKKEEKEINKNASNNEIR